jgi:hypothetical protein
MIPLSEFFLSQMNTIYFVSSCLFKMNLIWITHLCFGLSGLFPSPYPTKIFGLCHACPCLLILIDLVTLVIFGEQYKLLRFLVLNTVFSSTLFQCRFPLLGHSGLSKSIGCPGFGFLWFSAPFKVTVRLVIQFFWPDPFHFIFQSNFIIEFYPK